MKCTVHGLVLREVKTGEADRILHVLTPTMGVISVSAKGSMRPKNKLFSGSSLFCYSEWILKEGRSIFFADEATPVEVFFGLRQSIESIALASYIAELMQIFSPTGEEARCMLKLTLNSFFLLSNQKRSPQFVKTVFELRSLSEAGFMPEVETCAECGREEDTRFCFNTHGGTLLCSGCAARHKIYTNLDAAALMALRHIVLSEDDKIFSFNIPEESMAELNRVAEQFAIYNLNYPPKTLTFLKSLID